MQRCVCTIGLLLLLCTPAWAGYTGPTDSTAITTVKQALNAPDDTPCTLTGYLVKRLRANDDDYLFRDETGQIRVDIDDKLFGTHEVGANTKVCIHGEVDNDFGHPNTVDVKYLEIVP